MQKKAKQQNRELLEDKGSKQRGDGSADDSSQIADSPTFQSETTTNMHSAQAKISSMSSAPSPPPNDVTAS